VTFYRWRACLLIVFLGCLASAPTKATSAAAPSVTIDWSKGGAQDTPASCGDILFIGLQDHHTYTLYLRGKTSGTCHFHADGLTFHMPPNHGPTDPGTSTLYSFARSGADVVVSWAPGY